MTYSSRPCPRCRALTPHKTLDVELTRPLRWVPLFHLCLSCHQMGRFALNHVVQELYFPLPQTATSSSPSPSPQLSDIEARVLRSVSPGGSTVRGVSVRFRQKEGVRANEYQVKTLLDGLVGKGGVMERRVVDSTEAVLAALRGAQRWRTRSCPSCGGTNIVALYAGQDPLKRGYRTKAGSYCLDCGWYELSGLKEAGE